MAPRGNNFSTKMQAILVERSWAVDKKRRESYEKAQEIAAAKRQCIDVDQRHAILRGSEAIPHPQEDITGGSIEETNLEEGLLEVPLLRHQRIALAWMEKREQPVNDLPLGGILADDQGLGKTLSTIALILKNRPPRKGAGDDLKGGTLVVCPTSVLRQWATELKTKVSEAAGVTYAIHHGPRRTKDAVELAKFDVVFTTYAIVGIENLTASSWKEDGLGYVKSFLKIKDWRENQERRLLFQKDSGKPKKKPKTPGCLSKVEWFRVVLDEAQNIRSADTASARAAWGLQTQRRWCLSGTPIQNKMLDLYSYMRFLQYKPYEVYSKFHNAIRRFLDKDIQDQQDHREEYKKEAWGKVHKISSDIILRRTKRTMIGDEPILDLPPRIVNLEEVEFYPAEAKFYEKLEEDLKMEMEEAKSKSSSRDEFGGKSPQYLAFLRYLLRLRQACHHGSLVPKQYHMKTEPLGLQLCDVCHDVVEEFAMTSCNHICCEDCVDMEEGECLLCGKALKIDIAGKKSSQQPLNTGSLSKRSTAGCPLESSSKIDAAMKKLQAMPKEEKALVFSQWTGMLDLLELQLEKSGICFSRLDGSMLVAARDRAICAFTSDPKVRVFLISLKAGGVGLNLVAASHVLLLDLWWNHTVEDQAIDRAHRIGQTRPVTVTRFCMKDSVESRVVGIQENKRKLVMLALGDADLDGDSKLLGQLTKEEFCILLDAPLPQAAKLGAKNVKLVPIDS